MAGAAGADSKDAPATPNGDATKSGDLLSALKAGADKGEDGADTGDEGFGPAGKKKKKGGAKRS